MIRIGTNISPMQAPSWKTFREYSVRSFGNRTVPCLLLLLVLGALPTQEGRGVQGVTQVLDLGSFLSGPVQFAPPLRTGTRIIGGETGISAAGLGTDVQASSDPSFEPQNEPSIAINPQNNSIIVIGANDYRLVAQGFDAWAGVYTSNDSGRTWTDRLIPGFPGSNTTNALTGFGVASDPALAFDSQNNLYYVGIVFNRQPSGNGVDGTVFVSRSTDHGKTFTQTVVVAQGHGSNPFNDKPYITTDRTTGTVYVSWTKFTRTTATIQLSKSTDHGLTWTSPLTLSNSGVNQGSVPAASHGKVYVAWFDDVNNAIKIAKSTNNGTSFSSPQLLASITPLPSPFPNSLFRVNSFPSASVDPENANRLTVIFPDYSSGNSDIKSVSSVNGGVTWTGPVKVNDDNTNHDQFFPWATIDSGVIHVVFYDRREDPANHSINVYYSASNDWGTSFITNQKLTDVASDPDLGFGGQFIGDYIGLSVVQGHVHGVWTDTRNAVAGTSKQNNQDIFTEERLILRNIAVASVAPSRNFAYTGANVIPLNITTTLQNQGNLTESFTAQAYTNTTLVSSVNITSLPPGQTTTISLPWNTSSVTPGTYSIKVQLVPLPGETSLSDNQGMGGSVTVRKAGDVNGDGSVDVTDFVLVYLNQFTPTKPSPYDINNDGAVDLADFLLVYLHQFT